MGRRNVSIDKQWRWRFWLILLVLFLVLSMLIWRLVYLTLIDQSFLRDQGNARTIRTVTLPAYRGIITDRNGEPLAVSTPVASVWINPQNFSATQTQLKKLGSLLSIPLSQLKKRIPSNQSKLEFMYLKRQIDPVIAAKIKQLQIDGLHFQQEFRRYYPEGEAIAQLLGFTNIDDQGQEGIELAYNSWLSGISGKKRVLVDRHGQAVSDINILKEARPGHNLALSVDKRLQYLAYRELKNAVIKNEASSGTVVILRPNTGEVLAMANYPSFNPNKRFRRSNGVQRNRAVTDVFEPGSTIKAFSIANALESGHYQPSSKIKVSPGWFMIGRNKVRDEHDLGTIDLTEILRRSSNVGIAKVTLSLPPERLPNLLYKLGFAQRTRSGFPGESAGMIQPIKPWQRFSLATLAFGYGISVTDLQLAHAYSVLAANGTKYPITLLRADQSSQGERVLSPNVAKAVVAMLESVVEPGGTATRAQVKGYRVAGKTGTVRILGPNGYQTNHHIAFFVGIAPVSHPEFVVSVVIRDPKARYYYGGLVATPVFSRILSGALRIMAITPDRKTIAKTR